MILCDASRPHISGGRYVIPYSESVDGYLHAYWVGSPNPNKRGVRYSRTSNHPVDQRCPQCHRADA